MHSSATRRKAAASSPNRGRRMLAVLAGLVVVGGTVAVTQLASAETSSAGSITCPSVADKLPQVPQQARAEVDRNLALLEQQIREAANRLNNSRGQGGPNFVNNAILGPLRDKRTATIDRIAIAIGRNGQRPQGLGQLAACTVSNNNAGGNNGGNNNGGNNGGNNNGGNNGGNNNGGNNNAGNGGTNGLDVLGQDCSKSRLQPHNGFQQAPRCVNTAMGEVTAAAQNPSLLITGSPRNVRVNQGFTLRVSTRNLVRDRFLGAAAGGYYLESSFLNGQGLQRGHFHVACRALGNPNVAPDPAPAPAFFRAVEDGGGGAQPDQVEVQVTGIPTPGPAQCAVWAGDGSHRAPMMERANQTPAMDAVRINVTR